MELVTIGRLTAGVLSVATFAFLFINDNWRADNLFLVPDLILVALLAGAALLPNRVARAPLAIAFGFTAGVLSTSVASYAVRDELGAASLLGAVVAAGMAVLLLPGREPAPAGLGAR